MNRRDTVLALILLGVLPVSADAQQTGKVWRVGVLSPDQADSNAGKQLLREFPQALKRHGYVEGGNLRLEWRWPDSQASKLTALADDLVRQNVDLIVARTTGPIIAAMAATRAIPIVMLNGNFPVEFGLVQSLARPGGNVTGTAYVSVETNEKLLQLLKEIAPKTTRVTSLQQVRGSNPKFLKVWTAIDESMLRAAARLGISKQDFDVSAGTLEEVMSALEGMAKSRSEFMVYWGDARYRAHQAAIADFLLRRRIPSISVIPTYVESGGLAQYCPDVLAIFDRTASYVDRILKGARPADLPVELPAKYEFAVNLKTAKAIGMTIPQSILVRADRVIE